MEVLADPMVAKNAVPVAPAAAAVEPKRGVLAPDHDFGRLGHGSINRQPTDIVGRMRVR
jgi:hypothetical protein